MKDITLKDLLEAGCHFGHQANRWHPKASSYIYTERDGVHIIDLAKTRDGLIKAGEFLKNLAKSGGAVIFVGTKRQAREIFEEAAKKVIDSGANTNFYYLLERWPGGLLTNFDVMAKNLAKVSDLDVKIVDPSLTKKEKLLAKREQDRLKKYYGGLLGLSKLPDAIYLVDPKKEEGSVSEAMRTGVKLLAICDTNTDPSNIDYQIPANDDAVGSIKIITEYLAEAWMEGVRERPKDEKQEISSETKDKKVEAGG